MYSSNNYFPSLTWPFCFKKFTRKHIPRTFAPEKEGTSWATWVDYPTAIHSFRPLEITRPITRNSDHDPKNAISSDPGNVDSIVFAKIEFLKGRKLSQMPTLYAHKSQHTNFIL